MSQNRRHFLKNTMLFGGATLLTPQASVAQAIIKSFLRQAQAEAADAISPRYLVQLGLPAAPSRFQFDQWLQTNSTEPRVMVTGTSSTAFTYDSSGNVTGTEYRVATAANGLQVPHLFSTFSSSDMESFLSNFLVVRGYGSGQDGHQFNYNLQKQPLAGADSISGLISDYSDRYFKAVAYGGAGVYYSEKGVGRSSVGGTTPLTNLLGPIAGTSSIRTLRNNNQDVISALRRSLAQFDSSNKAAQMARGSLDSAYTLLNNGVGNYTAEWSSLVSEYLTVMNAAAREANVPGIKTKLDGSSTLAITSSNGYKVSSTGGVKDIAAGKNIVNMANEIDLSNLANSLALADYCIRNNYISSLEISQNGIYNLRADPDSMSTYLSYEADAHTGSGHVSMFVYSMFFRGLIAGLLKFKDRMTAAGKWDQVIFTTMSDFGRSVNLNDTGSDHSPNGMVTSVFSGVFHGGPYVVGNIYRGKDLTQPTGAPVTGFDPKNIPSVITNASSLYQLMAVPKNPWKNLSGPLYKLKSDGTIDLIYGMGKVVA